VSKAGIQSSREPRGIDFAMVAVERLLKSEVAEEHERTGHVVMACPVCVDWLLPLSR
jgi:hypothetical protein